MKITLFFLILLLTSCGDPSSLENDPTEKKTIVKLERKKRVKEPFGHPTWRIDSIAEANVVIVRANNDTVIQCFNFRKQGVFSAMEVRRKGINDRIIGEWQVEKDSLFIYSDKEKITMRYGFTLEGSSLTLHENLNGSSNRKKPSFYLSKYIENRNPRIFGPAK